MFSSRTSTPPVDTNDLRCAKYASQTRRMVDKSLRGLGTVGRDMRSRVSYPLFDDTIPQREYSVGGKEHLRQPAGHDGSPIILRRFRRCLPRCGGDCGIPCSRNPQSRPGIPLEIKRVTLKLDGLLVRVLEQTAVLCLFTWVGRFRYRTRCIRRPILSTADWNGHTVEAFPE